MTETGKSIMICAGDISGDQHASKVIAKLQETVPSLKVWGIGGAELHKTGAELLYRSEDLSIIGIVGIINRLPKMLAIGNHLIAEIEKRKPDMVLLVDYGGFNIHLAQKIRARFPSQRIVYFISPQVWGSRPWRMNALAKTLSKALVIFPFEEDLYRGRGIDASFVGHPLIDKFAEFEVNESASRFREMSGIDPAKPLVAIFPGSRSGEVRNFMPLLIQSMLWLRRERPNVQFAISVANERLSDVIYEHLHKHRIVPDVVHGTIQKDALSADIDRSIKLIAGDRTPELMAAGDVLWTKSGTTTLEATMLEKPMLVFYRGDWLSFMLYLLFKRVKYVAWPNLLAGRMLVPELIQLDCRAEQLVRYTRDWLDVPGARAEISRQLHDIKGLLRKGNFAVNAAAELAKTLAVKTEQPIEQHGR